MPISNSSPLIHLSRLGKLGYMKEAFSSILIPPAVRLETIEKGKKEGYSDALLLEKLEAEGWLQTAELSAKSRRVAKDLSDVVGEGEAEAISLAMEREDRLFVDDLKGRRLAEQLRIENISTLGIIFELLVNGIVTKVDFVKNVKNYGAHGWISGEIIQEFIERGQEL